MNANIPPYPTPTNHQTKTEKGKQKQQTNKHQKGNKAPRRPAAPMANSYKFCKSNSNVQVSYAMLYPVRKPTSS